MTQQEQLWLGRRCDCGWEGGVASTLGSPEGTAVVALTPARRRRSEGLHLECPMLEAAWPNFLYRNPFPGDGKDAHLLGRPTSLSSSTFQKWPPQLSPPSLCHAPFNLPASCEGGSLERLWTAMPAWTLQTSQPL